MTPYPGNGGGYQTLDVNCSSMDGSTQFCHVPTLVSGQLVRQFSQNACVEGRSFWIQPGQGISVAYGCGGLFRVTMRR